MYLEADWAGDLDGRHSTTWKLFLIARGAIIGINKKQRTVAEAKYITLCLATHHEALS